MAEDKTQLLVKKGDLEATLQALMVKDKGIVEDLEKILPSIRDETMKKGLEKKLIQSKERVVALEAGFIPIDTGWFNPVETKSKWGRQAVKEALASMPEEIREIWDRVKALGIFKSFSVSGGDPVLVGNAGGKHYFIGSWMCLTGGYSLGIRIRG